MTDNNEGGESQEDVGTGVQPQTGTLIDGAISAAERLEKATSDYKKENDRREKLAALEKLGGGTPTSGEPEPKKEMTASEYTKAVLSGQIEPNDQED